MPFDFNILSIVLHSWPRPTYVRQCDIVQEGEQEVSEVTEVTTYVLIHDQKSWSEARDICIASHGGKIAHLQLTVRWIMWST